MMLLLRAMRFRRPSPAQVVQLLRSIGLSHMVPPAPPPQEHLPRWRRMVEGLRHSPERDGKVIQHHYDVSNRFYEMVLGPSMTYTCACYPTDNATLEEAQEHKYDLVCRKLGLQAGMRLRKEIYEVGDSRDVNISIEKFLGRPRSLDPFLKKIGIDKSADEKK